jgi:plasmid stabilization system protein ParE
MKIVYMPAAAADLEDILAYTAENFPGHVTQVEMRLRTVLERISEHPLSARAIFDQSDVRVVPLVRFPFKVFYRAMSDRIEILHIRHVAQDEPDFSR